MEAKDGARRPTTAIPVDKQLYLKLNMVGWEERFDPTLVRSRLEGIELPRLKECAERHVPSLNAYLKKLAINGVSDVEARADDDIQ